MITREQVADLRPGDVVRVTGWQRLTVEGPVSKSVTSDTLWLGEYLRLSYEGADLPNWMLRGDATLTVVSRAPRPLYVNHPRTEPVPGDVVRDADGDLGRNVWMYADPDDPSEAWVSHTPAAGAFWVPQDGLPARLRLLVDGETGQAVQ